MSDCDMNKFLEYLHLSQSFGTPKTDYEKGLVNGLELAIAYLEKRDPVFIKNATECLSGAWHDPSCVPMIDEPVLVKIGKDIFLYEVQIFTDVKDYIRYACMEAEYEWCYCSKIGSKSSLEANAPEMYEELVNICEPCGNTGCPETCKAAGCKISEIIKRIRGKNGRH